MRLVYYDPPMSRFCEYLLQKGRITESQYTHAKTQVDTMNLKTGLSAYAFGFLEESQIREITGIQQRTGQRFGEVAVARGYLTEGQLRTILRIQEKSRVTLEDALVMEGAITPADLEVERRLYETLSPAP